MKYIKRYNESNVERNDLDKEFFNNVFIDLIESKVILDIKDNFNFFKKFYLDRSGSEGGVLILLKITPDSNHIDSYLKEFDECKENMLEIKTCIKRVEDEFPGIEHYIVTKRNNVNVEFDSDAFGMRDDMRKTDTFLYFWYPKRIKESKIFESKISTLDSLTDDELRERLKWLAIERDELLEEIGNINKLLRSRKENKESIYSKDLPESIFDFNQEQCEWIFEHHHGTTSKHYEIAQKYFSELGIYNSGFNPDTKQFYFTISSSSCFNEAEDGFKLNEKVAKSIKFLGNNLKKSDGGFVKFGVSYYYDEGERNDLVKYFNEGNLFYGIGYLVGRGKEYTSVEKLLEDVVANDLEEQIDRDRNAW
jgi:hypothetical protein